MSTTPDVTALLHAAGSWELDREHSSVAFRSTSLWGLVPVKGRFTGLSGGGTVGADGVVNGELVIDATSVTTGKEKRDTHLRSDDFFKTAQHPQIVFKASAITPESGDRVRVSGVLTIAHVSRPLVFDARLEEADNDRATFSAHVDIDRAAWDVTFRKMGMTKMSTPVDVVACFRRSSSNPPSAAGEPERTGPA
jgi:polyisoprenoid-binding protein YceI